ncbi:MAG: 5'-methylthioadenosine/adenosylhomocysteine nucleosidase [Flavobacteriaceae bacterium]|nr:5'-methylthioadenosine/adenosylhomocysteine nucleosidase [Flavobacteriaceae bacterium]
MIAIMSAMREELQTLVEHLENPTTTVKGKRRYHLGTLFGKNVVLVFSRWGKVAAATTATQLINDFELSEFLFSGVAGSVTDHLNIGDIVIGDKLYQYDINATPLYKPFEIPLLDKTYFETDLLRQRELLNAGTLFLNDFNTIISKEEATNFGIANPKVVRGGIASGDQFINSNSQINFIHSNLPSVVCVEMEGAAVAQVCYEYGVPFSIIRIVSDKANDNAHIDFEKFAAQIAGKYTLEILKNYLS